MKKFLFSISLILALFVGGCQSSSGAQAQHTSQSDETNHTTEASNETKASQRLQPALKKISNTHAIYSRLSRNDQLV